MYDADQVKHCMTMAVDGKKTKEFSNEDLSHQHTKSFGLSEDGTCSRKQQTRKLKGQSANPG